MGNCQSLFKGRSIATAQSSDDLNSPVKNTAAQIPNENFVRQKNERKRIEVNNVANNPPDSTKKAARAQKQLAAQHLTGQEVEAIAQTMRSHFFFQFLEPQDITTVVENMSLSQFAKGQFVFQQGEPGESFYVIRSGKFEVLIGDKRKRVLKQGDLFGELALINNAPRSASIRAIEDGALWDVDRATFRELMHEVGNRQLDENRNFIRTVPLLRRLPEEQRETVSKHLVEVSFSDQQIIVQEEEQGDSIFIIKEGSVGVYQKGQEIAILGKCDFFGERAIVFNEPRSATIQALGTVRCLTLDRAGCNEYFKDELRQFIYKHMVKQSMQTHTYFRNLHDVDKYLNRAVATFQYMELDQDSIVHQIGSVEKKLVFVIDGVLEVSQNNNVKIIKKGECFGLNYLKNDIPSNMQIVGYTGLKFLIATQDSLEKQLGPLRDLPEYARRRKVITSVFLLRHLSNKQLDVLAHLLKEARYEPNSLIIQQGEFGDQLFVIKEGEVSVMKNGQEIRHMGKWDYFGERALLYDEKRSASVIAVTDVTVWTIDKKSFLQIVGPLRQALELRISLQDVNFVLSDLEILKDLGKGTFGVVKLAKHSQTGTIYAIKCINKRQVTEPKQIENIRNERAIMTELDHPFIVKYVRSFKDAHNVYLLLEYLPGGELFDAIREIGLLTRDQARFYIGCILLAIEYIHERNILYRDLKPENIMLDGDGYLKLVDFGCAKKCDTRTFTLIGTPEYLAPEVILGKGYGKSADIWAAGVCLFEFVCGPLPFGNSGDGDDGSKSPDEQQLMIFREILKAPLEFPPYVKDDDAKDILSKMLKRNPEHRLGCSDRGVAEIKEHPFFYGFDWENLLNRTLRPPLVPAGWQERIPERGVRLVPENGNSRRSSSNLNANSWDADF
eukprot:GILI01000578.1.p1 GENE.GILI01000578.1~~GILI01000578.1.p1  ORF type:complete len:896 (+),score=318.89 GILI01000578.1:250-2937(+)